MGSTLILGAGQTGLAVADYFASIEASWWIAGDSEPNAEQALKLSEFPTAFPPVWGKSDPEGWQQLFSSRNVTRVVVSPGIPPSHPARQAVKNLGILETGDLDLAWEAIGPHPVVAITGTNGKTTTTELTGAMFRQDQRDVFVGGNVGVPWIRRAMGSFAAQATSVLEVSSYQLDVNPRFKASVGLITHVEPDHLDRYGTLERYAASKRQMLSHLTADGFAVLSADNPTTATFAATVNPARLALFSGEKAPLPTCHAEARFTPHELAIRIAQETETHPLTRWKLRGRHNLENLAAAALCARLSGVSAKAVQATIDTFAGVAHRIEWVGKIGSINCYNDSKGTNVGSVLRSLAAFEDNSVVLILGGRNKGASFKDLVPLVQAKCLGIVAYGEARGDLERDLQGEFLGRWVSVAAFDDAVESALSLAKSLANTHTVLLSPACASWDQFNNFEERGERFRGLCLSYSALIR